MTISHTALIRNLKALIVLGAAATPLSAAEFDIPDGDVAALIDAIKTANSNGEVNTINLAKDGIYILTAVDNATEFDGPNGLPVVTSELVINGNGATIQRNDDFGTFPFRIVMVSATGDLTLDSLTVKNGALPGDFDHGGGLLIYGTLAVNNCTISNNRAGFWGFGGGIVNYGNLTVHASLVIENSGRSAGGGIFNEGTLVMTDSIVAENSAVSGIGCWIVLAGGCSGGGIFNAGDALLTNCTISGNEALVGGGGIFEWYSTTMAVNCLIAGNHSGSNGGGWWMGVNANVEMVNCTIAENSAENLGGGIFISSDTPSTLNATNLIHWHNSPQSVLAGAGIVSIGHSNIQGGWTGIGNINADPLFVDAANGNFRLAAGSPSIDAGDNLAVPDGIKTDLEGKPRFVDGDCDGSATVDMGAYEFQGKTGDLNCDGFVDVSDLLVMLDNWGECDECDACPADLNGDCAIDVSDLLILLNNWG